MNTTETPKMIKGKIVRKETLEPFFGTLTGSLLEINFPVSLSLGKILFRFFGLILAITFS